MKLLLIAGALALAGCQSIQEKDALLVKDRVEKLQPLSAARSLDCTLSTALSAPQAVKYRTAFSQETRLVDDWQVTYDWRLRPSRCEVHAHPLTPATANQRTFLEEALCTLFQVFWAHSPFDGIRVASKDIVDQDEMVFLKQKEKSEVGIYLAKQNFAIETRTAKKGTYSARYQQQGSVWRPVEMSHDTMTFQFAVKDIQWSQDGRPTEFWIFVGDQGALQAHTRARDIVCR